MKSNVYQTIVALALIILLVLLWNPFHFWMPDMMLMSILALLIVAFGLFASFILRERNEDERDAVHRMLAGRAAFLCGSGALIIGIAYQSFSHNVDVWLILALVVMLVAKIITRMYSDKNL